MPTLEDRLTDLVLTFWNASGRPIQLTRLGTLLSREFDMRKELAGAKLLPFIQYKLPTRVRLLKKPGSDLTWGAVPADATLPTSEQDVLRLFERDETIEQSPQITFDRRIWAAFSIPLRPGFKRALTLAEPFSFEDIAGDAPTPSGKSEVESSFIIPTGDVDPRERSRRISTNILLWAERHGLNKDDISQKSVSVDGKSLLSQILAALNEQELSRISMPLDIVKKLFG